MKSTSSSSRPTKKSASSTAKSSANAAGSQQSRRDPASQTSKDQFSKNSKEQFIKKLQKCAKTYDWKDESKDVTAKGERLKCIMDLSQMLQDQKTVVSLIIPCTEEIMQMVEKNIFRPLPNVKKNTLNMADTGVDQEEEIDPAMPHIQGIYEFFLQFIVNESLEVRLLKQFVTPQFVQEFLDLFDSNESMERDYLKNILHKLYAKLVPRRKMIRKAMNECFYTLIHESHKFNGAAELLDILASIISGFAVPLRDEHVSFFNNVIIPLHKVQTCSQFYEQLLRCSMLFLTKDRTLAIPLLEGLLKYWPFANCVKETLFLTELQEVLEVCEVEKVQPLIPRLFKRIVKSIGGDHLQVADRAMCFFENDYFLNILKTYKDVTFPMLVPVIIDLAEKHWHRILQESLIALKTILKEIDPQQFNEAAAMKPEMKKKFGLKQDVDERSSMDQRWAVLDDHLKQTKSTYEVPKRPFDASKLICDYNPLYFKVYDKVKAIEM